MDNIPYIYEHIQDIILKHLINSYITNKSLKYYKYRNVCKLWMNHIDNEQYLAYSDNHSVNNKNRKQYNKDLNKICINGTLSIIKWIYHNGFYLNKNHLSLLCKNNKLLEIQYIICEPRNVYNLISQINNSNNRISYHTTILSQNINNHPINIVCRLGFVDILQTLIKIGYSITYKHLIISIKYNQIDITEYIIYNHYYNIIKTQPPLVSDLIQLVKQLILTYNQYSDRRCNELIYYIINTLSKPNNISYEFISVLLNDCLDTGINLKREVYLYLIKHLINLCKIDPKLYKMDKCALSFYNIRKLTNILIQHYEYKLCIEFHNLLISANEDYLIMIHDIIFDIYRYYRRNYKVGNMDIRQQDCYDISYGNGLYETYNNIYNDYKHHLLDIYIFGISNVLLNINEMIMKKTKYNKTNIVLLLIFFIGHFKNDNGNSNGNDNGKKYKDFYISNYMSEQNISIDFNGLLSIDLINTLIMYDINEYKINYRENIKICIEFTDNGLLKYLVGKL